MPGPLPSPHWPVLRPGSVHGEQRVVRARGLSGERAPRVFQRRGVRAPPSSLSERPVRPERALSTGTALPGSTPKKSAPENLGEHPRTGAPPHPGIRIRYPLRSRAAGREDCEPGAVRAPRCKPLLEPAVTVTSVPPDGELSPRGKRRLGAARVRASTSLCSPRPCRRRARQRWPAARCSESRPSLHFGAAFKACHRSLQEQPP